MKSLTEIGDARSSPCSEIVHLPQRNLPSECIWADSEAILGQSKQQPGAWAKKIGPPPVAVGAGLWTAEIKKTPTRVPTIDTRIPNFSSLENPLP